MVEANEECDLDALLDDEAIEAFCQGIDGALDEVMGSKVSDYQFLVRVLTEAMATPATKEDFVANLMQKDELIEVGVFKLEHSDFPKPERLPRELAIENLATSIFAGSIYTSDREKITALIERRHSGETHFTSKQLVSIAKSLMIEFAKEQQKH